MTSATGQWWSAVWRSSIGEAFGEVDELESGRRLARRAGLPHPEVSPGSMILRDPDGAWVAQLGVRQLGDDQWDGLMGAVAENPRVAAAVVTGELPVELHGLAVGLGRSLAPERRDLGADCTCPDWHEPCRHVGALVAIVADMVEADPWLLAMLRGRTRDQIVQSIRSHRAGRLDVETAESGDSARGADLGVDAVSAFRRTPDPLPAPVAGLRRPGQAVAFPAPPVDAGVDMADLERLVNDAAVRAFLLLAGESDVDALLIDPVDDQARIELSRRPRDP
jgi:uncharacterized Zn finger protein